MIFTIIRPMFSDIQSSQSEIARYRQAVSTAGQFNAHLNQLRNRANSFSGEDLGALETYVPSSIDQLSVSRDILAIVEENGMVAQAVSADEAEGGTPEEGGEDAALVDGAIPPEDPALVDPAMDPMADPAMAVGAPVSLANEANRSLQKQQFTLEVLGSYDQMKELLIDFERNEYPLRLTEFEFSTDTESDAYAFTIVLETYALVTNN